MTPSHSAILPSIRRISPSLKSQRWSSALFIRLKGEQVGPDPRGSATANCVRRVGDLLFTNVSAHRRTG